MPYFTFTDASQDVFVLRLTDPDLVAHARALLAGEDTDPRIGGTVVKAPVDWNIGWSFHVAPESAFFFEMSTEVGDSTMAYIEAHLAEVGGALLPGSVWTGWSSELTGELSLRGGTAGDDSILGGGAAELMRGRGGQDRIEGRGGADHIAGGAGRDDLQGGSGADRMDGGAEADLVRGGWGRDLLLGGTGADRVEGGGNADRLRGGAGRDDLQGGAGDDRLAGGGGDDRVDGGWGNDLFVIRPGGGHDRIVLGDEAGNRDTVDLRAFDLLDLAPLIDAETGDVTLGLVDGDRITLVGYAKTYEELAFGDNLLL